MVKSPKTPPAKPEIRQQGNQRRRTKKSKHSETHPIGGRPPGPEEDRRSERMALRMHPDLIAELKKVSRATGHPRSAWIESVLISVINNSYPADVLDRIGKYLPPYEKDHHPANNEKFGDGLRRPFAPFDPLAKLRPVTRLTVDQIPPPAPVRGRKR